MKAARVGAAVFAMVGVVSLGGTLAHAKDPAIQKLMSDNFADLQSILTALVMSNYVQVPERIQAIQTHATELTLTVPEIAKADPDRFVTYAYNLRAHAADLDSIVAMLIERDKTRAKDEPATDQLREAAAAHYGGMVTMCVSCHNRFRPLVASP
jgi:hypothetical protein